MNNAYDAKILNTLHLLSYFVAGTMIPRFIGKINDRSLHETPASVDNIGDGGGLTEEDAGVQTGI